MNVLCRRGFLKGSALSALGCAINLSFLRELGHAAAGETAVDPDEVRFGPGIDPLVALIQTTSRDKCVPTFITQLQAGLSYQRFLASVFLAALRTGDPHQVAQVYAAHRVGSEARIEERLLPLFWALDRVNDAYQTDGNQGREAALRTLTGSLPTANSAASVLADAMAQHDPDLSERSVVALARSSGARSAMVRLWEFAPRSVGGTLGHPAIALANGVRTLDAMGWQHAEPVMRYAARYVGSMRGDNTHASNLELARRTVPWLPAGWAASAGPRAATLELYAALRECPAADASSWICSRLSTGEATAGPVWDAIHLAAADLLFRHSTGGSVIGGFLIHVVTTTNALRFGFDLAEEPRTRMLCILQAAGMICDFFVARARNEGLLRKMSLLDLGLEGAGQSSDLGEVFDRLPAKADGLEQKLPEDRKKSDDACRRAFALLRDPKNEQAFLQTARGFLCAKASRNPHDVKYPAAAFEDAYSTSPEWRPYLLASSVHALHGSKSDDAAVLVQARDALR
ncbi:MAG TPA: hypothetical protein VMT52_00060 [Planctomycetota bacterium]|nr:hypothetical protein [Planctomycetota bacterium]